MTEPTTIDGSLHDDVGAIRAQLVDLTDLFRRRLSDDRDKRRLLEQLDGQLQLARGGLAQQFLLPLVRELLLVADRAVSVDDQHAQSIGAELLEALKRYGVESLPDADQFDPTVHEASRSVSRPPAYVGGDIAATDRVGFRWGETLIRPARVAVYVEATPVSGSIDVGVVDGSPAR